MWRELWFSMAKGSKVEYDRIKATPVLEFWGLYDLWRERIKQEVEAMKKANNKKQ